MSSIRAASKRSKRLIARTNSTPAWRSEGAVRDCRSAGTARSGLAARALQHELCRTGFAARALPHGLMAHNTQDVGLPAAGKAERQHVLARPIHEGAQRIGRIVVCGPFSQCSRGIPAQPVGHGRAGAPRSRRDDASIPLRIAEEERRRDRG